MEQNPNDATDTGKSFKDILNIPIHLSFTI